MLERYEGTARYSIENKISYDHVVVNPNIELNRGDEVGEITIWNLLSQAEGLIFASGYNYDHEKYDPDPHKAVRQAILPILDGLKRVRMGYTPFNSSQSPYDCEALSFITGGRKIALNISQSNPLYPLIASYMAQINPLFQEIRPHHWALTIKGTGPKKFFMHIINKEYFESEGSISGFNGFSTKEFDIPENLRGIHEVRTLTGEIFTYNYFNSRETLGAAFFARIKTSQRLIYFNYSDEKMPLATGLSNQLAAILFIETGGQDLENIKHVHAYEVPIEEKVQAIKDNLSWYPYFKELMERECSPQEFMEEYLRLVITYSYYDAQVEEINLITGRNRSQQNTDELTKSRDWDDTSIRIINPLPRSSEPDDFARYYGAIMRRFAKKIEHLFSAYGEYFTPSLIDVLPTEYIRFDLNNNYKIIEGPTLSEEIAVRVNVAKNLNINVQTLELLAWDVSEEVRAAVAMHPTTSEKTLAKLAKDHSKKVRESVAKHPKTSAEILSELAFDAKSNVVRNVAAHPNTLIYTLENLALSKDSFIRKEVARNSRLSSSILAHLALDSDLSIREAVAKHPNTSIDVLVKLCSDSKPAVRLSLARNHYLPQEILALLALDDSIYVRKTIFNHPNITPEIKDLLWAEFGSSLLENPI